MFNLNHEPRNGAATRRSSGFTLIELSIILVIIGLLVGAILTGQNLIDAAAQRAQVTQITRYNTAVNTFRGKYGGLPGDLPDPAATQFGFQSRGTHQGQGDGNGLIEGNCDNNTGVYGMHEGCGENAVFWVDLTTASLIDAGIVYKGAGYPSPTALASATYLTSTPAIKDWLPAGKIGNGNYVYVYSMNGYNYFSISAVYAIVWYTYSSSNPGITVQQAYNIDKKIDDGLPQSGSVNACYSGNAIPNASNWGNYAAGGGLSGADGGTCTPTTVATPYASTNCYDNNNVAGPQQYSLTQNANAQNCALSFKFQ
jgi:type II secretory pathway pseudopilin PulG